MHQGHEGTGKLASDLEPEEAAGSDEDGGLEDNEDVSQERHGREERLGDAGPENGPVSLINHTSCYTRNSESLHLIFIA